MCGNLGSVTTFYWDGQDDCGDTKQATNTTFGFNECKQGTYEDEQGVTMDVWQKVMFPGNLCSDWEDPCPEGTNSQDFCMLLQF
eukprot:UN03218